MVVLHLTDCPIGLRGALTKWLLEVASGVFVGQVSARVKDELWSQVKELCRNGRAVLVFSTNGEQRLDFRVHGDTWEPIDFDGIKLILRPSVSRLKARREDNLANHGFSNASKQRTAKRFSEMRSRFPENYVVVDLETTGLNPETDDIIEIGAIKMLRHERIETFDAIIKTERSIPSGISEMTGINEQMLSDSGELLCDVLIKLSSFLGNLPIVGHNIDFDKSFLLNACAKCGCPLIVNRCIDTLSLARRLIKGVENHKLDTLAVRFGIERGKCHRGVNDCETTAQVYRKLIDLIDSGSEKAGF